MKVPCEIDTTRTLKKGMKITLEIDDEQKRKVLKDLYNFEDMPLIVTFEIDAEKQRERMERISPEQRKKIYAIFHDIDNACGQGVESIKYEMKKMFLAESEYEMFSLSDCEKELAGNFIEFLIKFCFEQGIPLKDNPKDAFEDIERYLRLCLDKHICCICGKDSTLHHWDAIGAGRNRNKVDDSELRKIALCPEHHAEAEQIGKIEFKEKYHVWGVIYEKDYYRR